MTSSKSGWLIALAALAVSSIAGGITYLWEDREIRRARKDLWDRLEDPDGEDDRHALVPLSAAQVTDWYLAAKDPIAQGWVYPGRVRLACRPDLHAVAQKLHAACVACEPSNEFHILMAGQSWKGQVIETIGGDVFSLRRVVASSLPLTPNDRPLRSE